MNHADDLLEGALQQPNDPAPWLVLSDWLEEQGDPISLARAELLRLQAAHLAATDKAARRKLDDRAAALVRERPELIGALKPIVDTSFPVLFSPSAWGLFLLADNALVVEQPFAPGTTWEGKLHEKPYSFPTTLQLRKRKGNHFEGYMKEDFSSYLGAGVQGGFYFRGVVALSRVAFVTYRRTGAAAGPGLYQFRLSRRRRLNGTWQVGTSRGGKMWLQLKLDKPRST
jgi:uncharacterized protein (TIGR02996 family)